MAFDTMKRTLQDMDKNKGRAHTSCACSLAALIVLFVLGVYLGMIYSGYALLGYYTEWHWFVRVVLAFVGVSVLTHILMIMKRIGLPG